MNCSECKEKRKENNIGIAASEGEAMRQHKVIQWLICVIALLIVLLVGSNCAWLYYESQLTDETITYEAKTDSGGTAVVNGGEGDVNINGNSENND